MQGEILLYFYSSYGNQDRSKKDFASYKIQNAKMFSLIIKFVAECTIAIV